MAVVLNQHVPDFHAEATGGPIELNKFKGSRLVLYFYPKDATPGCTTEAQNFRDLYEQFKRAGAEIFGISRDSIASHERFKANLGFPFELIADTDERLCKLFDVMKEKKLYGKTHIGVDRSTFVIDETGTLVKEWRGVKVPGHVQEVLEFVVSLSESRKVG